MSFITKLDFSSNRQVKQFPETFTVLSGGTKFGVPYSGLATGPDLTTTAVTQTYTNLVSTFSGNTGTTVFSWYDPNMALGEPYLSAITPSTSAITQNTGVIFTANTLGTTIDGYTYAIDYSGVSFDLVGLAMIDLGGGNYSGSVHTNTLEYYSAGTIDYSGRTIWVDVSGITRTEDLIITNSPVVGYVWKCVDGEGKGAWAPDASGNTTYWTAGTLTNSIIPINNSSKNNKLGINIDPQTAFDLMATDGSVRLLLSESIASNGFTTSGTTSGYTQIGVTTKSNNTGGFGLSIGSIGSEASIPTYGQTGTTFIFSSGESNGLNIIKNSGAPYTNNDNYIRFYAGGNVSTIINAHMHIQGSGITQGYIGLNTLTPTQRIDVNGSARFRSVQSLGGGSVSLYIDTDGTLSLTASDERLKENITPITNALETVKSLKGVNFNWKSNGQPSLGFIAQDVNLVEPKLVFTNENTEEKYMGVNYEIITALLVEAIKELTSGSTVSGNTYLETQSIIAEDNNIDLNYGGNQQTAFEGGIRVLHALGQDLSAELLTDEDGNWRTNNDFKPKAITIPIFTPLNSTDKSGNVGNITRDEDYLYVKTSDGWRRSRLESF